MTRHQSMHWYVGMLQALCFAPINAKSGRTACKTKSCPSLDAPMSLGAHALAPEGPCFPHIDQHPTSMISCSALCRFKAGPNSAVAPRALTPAHAPRAAAAAVGTATAGAAGTQAPAGQWLRGSRSLWGRKVACTKKGGVNVRELIGTQQK